MDCRKLSVVIPYYNGSKYVDECLESIRAQHCDDCEILIINDGSTEDIEILRTICSSKYSNLDIQIVSKENEGQGSARNYGMRIAKGEYLFFVDQDDTVPEGTFNHLIGDAEREKVDLVISGYQRVDYRGHITKKIRMHNAEWSKYRCVAPWGKLYRRDFLLENNISFLPVVLGEDIYFMLSVNVAQPRVYISSIIGYNWRLNEASVSNTRHKKIDENTSIIKLFKQIEMIDNIEELNKDYYLEYFYIKTAIWDILYTRNNDLESVINNSELVWKWFEEYYPNYISNPYLSLWGLRGEGFRVRWIVWIFMFFHRRKKDDILLKIINKVT